MKKLALVLILLALAIGVAGFWYWQKNPYSKEILKLEILGPDTAQIGQEVEYTVKYKNNGNIRLDEPKLAFEFPDHTIFQDNQTQRQEIGPDTLGDIYPGEEKSFTFKGRLLGQENDILTAKAEMTYKPHNLESAYKSDTTFSIKLTSAPLTFDFDLPSKVESGRNFQFSLNYFSGLDYPLANLGIQVQYPDGFEFIKSVPSGVDKTDWEVPLLNKAEGGRIEIQGKLSGATNDQKIFQAKIGVWQDNEFIVLKTAARGVELSEQGLLVFQRINGQDDYLAEPGTLLHYEVFFRNIGHQSFSNLFLVSKLEGKAFDFSSIKSDSGQFNQDDGSIVFDWRQIPKLSFLDQGDEGKVEFWISLKDDFGMSGPGDKNPIIKNTVLISQIKEEFDTKVSSKLALLQKGFYQDEVFGNSGPIPPVAGQQTTYTITWQAKNYYNDVNNVKVKAVLPQNVRLTGSIFPDDQKQKFSFDNASREIVWSLGDVLAGTGVLNTPASISFQVALVPTSDQRGQLAPLVQNIRILGEDQWTGKDIERKTSDLNTSLPDDSSVSGRGQVQ